MPRFSPKLGGLLHEGYGGDKLTKYLTAGMTVAVVALPLSMAIAIASHAPPEAGLYASIIGGFLISALGGSRFQIGGPAGAFIVLVSSIIDSKGFGGLLLSTMMAGIMMVAAGALRLGTLVRLVPQAVTVGFSAGIAVIIAASQLHDYFGLTLQGPEPGPVLDKLRTLMNSASSVNASAVLLASATAALILIVRRLKPHWPALLIAVVAVTFATSLAALPVETVGDRFGATPNGMPRPVFPSFTSATLLDLLPAALSLAVLGSIESLLSAVVADQMSGRQHRPNTELVAQGIANILTPLFGGITVTGTIARTATNVRAGAASPVSGMLHAAFLLVFTLVAAPLLGAVPLAALAGLLMVVAFNMVEWHAIFGERRLAALVVIVVTLLVTVFRDLLEGIAAGIVLNVVLQRLSRK
jgi:sulfate permease, SulP family